MDAPPIRYCKTSDGVSIAYALLGEGRPLVYASNVWGDLHWYRNDEGARMPIDALVAAGWQVVRYDARGMGSSDRDVADLSADVRVRDLEAVVDALRLERFPVCGYGQGGPVAILYTLAHAERVSHLILVNSFAVGSEYYRNIPAMRALKGLQEMAEEQWEFFTLTLATAVTNFDDRKRAQRTAELFRSSMAPATFRSFVDAAERIDVTHQLSALRVPTLVVQDTRGFVTGDLSKDLAKRIPASRFVSVESYVPELHRFVVGEQMKLDANASEPSVAGTAIILFADIANSTALTEDLGDAAFRDKARDLDEALRRAITSNGGTAIDGKLLGDGVLATFGAAREAIACASAIHDAGSNVELPVHVGIHAGDVIREDDNVYGGAVNIASRVANEAAAGETLVSATVRDLARTSAGVTFEDRGERELKGVGEPVRLYAVHESASP